MVQSGDKMIKIGNTGFFFDGGNKGHLDIYYRDEGKFIHLNCDNLDCTSELFRIILGIVLDSNLYNSVNQSLKFLEANEDLFKYAFEHQVNLHKHMGKCYHCGADVFKDTRDPERDLCPPFGITADYLDKSKLRHFPSKWEKINPKDLPIRYLKDFDLRWPYVWGLHLECRIKSIKNPVVKRGEYYTQECILCDNDTSKTLNAKLDDSVAEFDKWYAGNKVEIIGEYKNGLLYVTHMEHVEDDHDTNSYENRFEEHPDYSEWRNNVIKRDNHCVCCGLDKHLEAHHLFGYKENQDLATNINNGVTLCKFCHKKYHSIYGLKNINPVDFMNFIKKYGVR